MGLWYGAVVIFGVFTSLYFMYSTDRMDAFRDPKVAVAEIFKKCHDAAVAELKSTTLGSAGAVSRTCTYDATGATGLMNSFASGMSVNNIIIRFHPGTDVGLSATDRVAVTYLPTTTRVNGVDFNEVWAQIGQRYFGDPSVGLVENNGATAYISSDPTVQATVPVSVPDGAIAMVTTIAG